MSEAKFTGGPWWFEEDEHCWQLFGGRASQTLTFDGISFESYTHPRQILKAPKKDTPYAEYWPVGPDAHLIAASPDLYAAVPDPDKLELLADWFDKRYPNDQNPEVQSDLREWARLGRTALAKARGEA